MRTFEQGQEEERQRNPVEERTKTDELIVLDPSELSDEVLERITALERVETIVQDTPDNIFGVDQGSGPAGGLGGEVFPPGGGGGQLGDIEGILRGINREAGDVNVDFPDINVPAGDAEELLNTIASIMIRSVQVQTVMLSIMRAEAQLLGRANQNLDSIDFNLRPYSAITVSGTNSIEEADSPELVVPDSEDTEVPTRTLFVRASTSNKADIFIGDDEVAPSSGYRLGKGEGERIDVNLVDEQLYMASRNAGQSVELLGVI